MSTYVILTRFTQDTDTNPAHFRGLAEKVEERVKRECPAVTWKESFSTAGSCDVVDIVESDDAAEVQKAAMLIRDVAHARTETLTATPWKHFLEVH